MPKGEVSGSFRMDIRNRLKGLDNKRFAAVAKSFGVNIRDYAKAKNPGLAKMAIGNSIVGAAVRRVLKDGDTEKAVLASVK